MLTADQSLEYQHNLTEQDVPILVMAAGTNRFEDLKELAPQVLIVLDDIRPGQVMRVGA